MRRIIIFAIVTLLGFAPLVVRSVSAQSGYDSEAWRGVMVGKPVPFDPVAPDPAFNLLADFLGEPRQNQDNQRTGAPSLTSRLDGVYPVTFENPAGTDLRAFIPEVQGAEFMVVIVESGEFVIDVKGPGSFLVDPVVDPELESRDVDKIRIMHVKIRGNDVHYTPTEQFVLDEKGRECTSLCTVLPGVAIQVTDGDRIIAPAGAICIWCLINQNEHAGESRGQLYVFPLLGFGDTFSWARYGAGSATVAVQAATLEVNGDTRPEQMTGTAAWAFFNPAGNCRSP